MIPFTQRLACRLAELDNGQLQSLFTLRQIPTAAAWEDFFDAAQWLQSPEAVTFALGSFTRAQAAQACAAIVDSATPNASPNNPLPDSVLQLLQSLALALPDGALTPDLASLLPHPVSELVPESAAEALPGPPPADPSDLAHLAETAWNTTAAITEIILATVHTPVSTAGASGLAAAERQRISALGIAEEDVDDLVEFLIQIQFLTEPTPGNHTVSEQGLAWVADAAPQRWLSLAQSFSSSLPVVLHGNRQLKTGWQNPADWLAEYPWSPSWPDQAQFLLRTLGRLGLGSTAAEPPWATDLRTDITPDLTPLEKFFPPEVNQLFFQADLTALALGAVHPKTAAQLREIAKYDPASSATLYQITAETLLRGLNTFESAAALADFLRSLSINPLPQPLEYLLEDLQRRSEQIVLSESSTDGGSILTVSDGVLAQLLRQDQGLAALRLSARSEQVLHSSAPLSVTLAMFADARYPVSVSASASVTEDQEHPDPAGIAPVSNGTAELAGPHDSLIQQLRAGPDPCSPQAGIRRALQTAVKERTLIEVSIEMPSGEVTDFVLTGTGITKDRLRGHDARADTERTLPISRIRAVTQLPPLQKS